MFPAGTAAVHCVKYAPLEFTGRRRDVGATCVDFTRGGFESCREAGSADEVDERTADEDGGFSRHVSTAGGDVFDDRSAPHHSSSRTA